MHACMNECKIKEEIEKAFCPYKYMFNLCMVQTVIHLKPKIKLLVFPLTLITFKKNSCKICI